MAGNPPSLWRRVTDLGPRADKLRAALPPHLELPEDAYTTHEVVRRDGEPLTSSDWYDVAGAILQTSPSLPVGLITASDVRGLRTGDVDIVAHLQVWARTRLQLPTSGSQFFDCTGSEPAAGVIRLRPDGTIPAITRPRTADVRAPWRVTLEAIDAGQRLADRWNCSQSQAVSRALVERLAQEQAGEARLENAVLDRVLGNRPDPQK